GGRGIRPRRLRDDHGDRDSRRPVETRGRPGGGGEARPDRREPAAPLPPRRTPRYGEVHDRPGPFPPSAVGHGRDPGRPQPREPGAPPRRGEAAGRGPDGPEPPRRRRGGPDRSKGGEDRKAHV